MRKSGRKVAINTTWFDIEKLPGNGLNKSITKVVQKLNAVRQKVGKIGIYSGSDLPLNMAIFQLCFRLKYIPLYLPVDSADKRKRSL